MQFSAITSKDGILQEIATWCFGSSSNDDTTAYPLLDKTRNANRWYDRVVSLIMQADGNWEWDDINQTDLPVATTALVANQQDYGLDAAVQYKLLRVEILNSDGDAKQLNAISQTDKRGTALTEYQETAGTPNEYDLVGNSIFLYPKPSYAKALGLKLHFQRGASYFASTDTTKEPGFNRMFHRILSFGPAYDYALANGLQSKINLYRDEIAQLEAGLIKFYSGRNRDAKIQLRLRKTDYGQGVGSGTYSDNTIE